MRTVEEIKADRGNIKPCDEINTCYKHPCCVTCPKDHNYQAIWLDKELTKAIIADIPLDELEEICQAEREKRVVVLPCKVGDIVYAVRQSMIFNPITEYKITMVTQKKSGKWQWRATGVYKSGGTSQFDFTESEFGKTVFLTRESAEKALEGMK